MNNYYRNPHKLYKNSRQKVFAGVCSGMAEYLGISTIVVRICALLFLLTSFPLAILIYVILFFHLDERPIDLYKDEEEEKFWRQVSFGPKETISELNYKIKSLSERIKVMEDRVTRREFNKEKAFDDLRNS